MKSNITTDERFARVMESNIEGTRLVTREREFEIRNFRHDLAALEASYGLELKPGDDRDFEIIDTRRKMPQGYDWSAIITRDGKLEIAEFVPEE